MASSVWCVKPVETAPVTLTWATPDGDTQTFWVKLKKRLTVGEEKRIQQSGWTGFRPAGGSGNTGPEIAVDWREQSFTRTLTWVTAWSLEDEKADRLPLTRDVIETLHPDVYALIEGAINDHVKGLAEEKKLTNGASAPSATSA